MSDYPYRMLTGCPAADCDAVNAAITTFWPERDSEDPTFIPNASADGSEPASHAVVSAPATEAMVEGMRELRESVAPDLWIYKLDAKSRTVLGRSGGVAAQDGDRLDLADALSLNNLQKIIEEKEPI